MKTYEYAGAAATEPRSHPWHGSSLDARARYLDLTAAPELIRTALEDFEPFRRYPATEEFYALLERVNHPKSLLESNDCAFTGPHPIETPGVKASLECSGRVMLLYRDLDPRKPVSGSGQRLRQLRLRAGGPGLGNRKGGGGEVLPPGRAGLAGHHGGERDQERHHRHPAADP